MSGQRRWLGSDRGRLFHVGQGVWYRCDEDCKVSTRISSIHYDYESNGLLFVLLGHPDRKVRSATLEPWSPPRWKKGVLRQRNYLTAKSTRLTRRPASRIRNMLKKPAVESSLPRQPAGRSGNRSGYDDKGRPYGAPTFPVHTTGRRHWRIRAKASIKLVRTNFAGEKGTWLIQIIFTDFKQPLERLELVPAWYRRYKETHVQTTQDV